MLKIDILTSEAQIEALVGEWRQLQAAAGTHPFTDYDWFSAWWVHLAKPDGRLLHIVTGRRDGKLTALFPLVILQKSGLRILENIGRDTFYPCDMLLADSTDAKEIWDAVRRSRAYDFADIRSLDPATPCAQALAHFATQRATDDILCTEIKWPNSDAWMASSKDLRRHHGRRVRRLEERGVLKYHIRTSEPVPADVVNKMIADKTEWCRRNKKHGLFDHSGVTAYINHLLEANAKSGAMHFGWLQCGDSVIGHQMGFVFKDTLYTYIVSHDMEWSLNSPGNVAKVNSICWAIDKGMHMVNMMQGETGSKRQYSNHTQKCMDYTFSNSASGHLKEVLYTTARALWQRAKKLRTKSRLFERAANDEVNPSSAKEAAA